ncbi:Radical SAM protein [Balamuthia mandrillaris]
MGRRLSLSLLLRSGQGQAPTAWQKLRTQPFGKWWVPRASTLLPHQQPSRNVRSYSVHSSEEEKELQRREEKREKKRQRHQKSARSEQTGAAESANTKTKSTTALSLPKNHNHNRKPAKDLSYSSDKPVMVYSDERGQVVDYPFMQMAGMVAGREGMQFQQVEEWIPLPEGSQLFTLQGRAPIGYNPHTSEFEILDRDPSQPRDTPRRKRTWPPEAVAAFVAPAYTHTHLSAYESLPGSPILPLYAYTAVGLHRGKFVVAATRTDADERQDAKHFDDEVVASKAEAKAKSMKDNRLVWHLARCALEYNCACSKNYFLGRWEAPIPVSSECNARCVGCISLQDEGDQTQFPSSQERIDFTPTPEEIAEIAIEHLSKAPGAVVSFGQGCEGEPLLQAMLIADAITRIRKATSRGTININTNGMLPRRLALLRDAGLDSARISLNSVRPRFYNAYYRPTGGTESALDKIKESLIVMKEKGGHTAINYLVMAGFTDEMEEFEELCRFIEETKVDLIQWRNLNIDPEYYLQKLDYNSQAPSSIAFSEKLGMRRLLAELKQRFPHLSYGYFNPCLDNKATKFAF